MWAKNLLVLAIGLVAALVLAEGVLRVVGFARPSFYQPDPVLGGTLRPGAEGWWTTEGRAYVKINSDGLRDEEHAVQKPEGTYRIAILGDSYAEGLQLPINKLFWKVMERRLNAECRRPERQFEVINFGVAGFGTGRELLMLRSKVWKYQPDLVVLAFLTGNDVRDNSKELNRQLVGEPLPYFHLADGRLVLDESYLDRYRPRSAIAALFFERLDNVRLVQLAMAVRAGIYRSADRNAPRPPAGGETGLDDKIYQEPQDEAWRDAWAVTEALIEQIKREVRARGARLLLATLSNGIQVNPDPTVRADYSRRLGVPDLLYPDRRIMMLALEKEIRHVMMAPILRQWAEQHGTCVHGFANASPCGGHWNEHGHRIAAEILATDICGWLDEETTDAAVAP